MFFKSLEIHGFKSFADKTVLNFDAQTTAVVGSNGNGKSNISDALRWVMGEQGAKTLRGEKMEDVIFHGTTDRKPMGFARVALCIDNTDRALPVDADEVTISRKLYRSGESEFLINGAKSRLKDIQEMLLGTGLGRDGYSIIGQGRVAEIVNARGTQRREIFEEAAGISLFLHKKAEAEKELQSAEDNITRQKDIIKMDEERLPVLKKQSEKAVLAAELLDKKKELEISVGAAHYEERRTAIKKLDDDLLLNRAECEHYEKDAEKLQNSIDDSTEKKQRVQAELERFRRSRDAVNTEIAEKRSQIGVLENDLMHNQKRRTELSGQIANAEESSRSFDEGIKVFQKKIEDKQAELSVMESRQEDIRAKLSEIEKQSAESSRAYSELEQKLAKAYREKGEASARCAQAEHSVEEAEDQKRTFLSDAENSEARLREYTGSREAAEKSIADIAEQRSVKQNRLAGLQRLGEGKTRRMNEAKAEADRVRDELDTKQKRWKLLEDVERSMEGYTHSVKELMRASQQGRMGGIHGTVADVVSMDERYVAAIETALGAAMQNIIVDNEETAKRCIRFLKETNAGRATMLPITAMKGRYLNEPRLQSEQGFEGIASDLVECDGEYLNIIRYLLGLTAIVDDIDTAAFLSRKYGAKFRIVTLDGQVVNAGGSFTGGSRGNGAGIISRKQEKDSLYNEVIALRKALAEKNEAYQQYQAEAAKFAMETEGAEDELKSLDAAEINSRAELSKFTMLIEQLSQQGETSRLALERFDAQIKQYNAQISESRAVIEACDKDIAEIEERQKQSGDERDSAAAHIKELSDSLSQLGLDKVAAEKDIDAFRVEIRSREENRRMLFQSSDSYKENIAALEADDDRIRVDIERVKKEIEQHSGELTDKDKDITRSMSEIEQLELSIGQMHRDISEANRNKEHFAREVARLEERRTGEVREQERIVNMLHDSYDLTVSMAVEQAKPLENLLAAENELEELRKNISRLGSVNMDSIEEYREVAERYKFQTAQLEDIEKSKRELEKLIADLTEDIKTRFLNSFEEINKSFREIFVSIFGDGAHGELKLTDPEDVLGSGIEILAAPPGKVIKNLISLSGGEQTMVAITIYFAILRHRPTPFCMLDEVDAALDDVNVDKYITYLNQFSSQTQLMVITHRRGTIEGCKVLYGVFMQEKGVSRLLRRDLADELDVELK